MLNVNKVRVDYFSNKAIKQCISQSMNQLTNQAMVNKLTKAINALRLTQVNSVIRLVMQSVSQ